MQRNLTETMMKQYLWSFVAIILMSTLHVYAENYKDLAAIKLETPEMKPELVKLPANPFAATVPVTTELTGNNNGMDFDFFKSKTNPGVKPHKFMDDMTFV